MLSGRLWRWAAAGGTVLAAGLLAATGFRSASGPAVTTAAVRSGSVPVRWTGQALVVRDEEVYAAPISGLVRWLAADGEHVRVGDPVVRIEPPAGDAVVLTAQSPGLVSDKLDGLEEPLAPYAHAWLQGRRPDPGPGPRWLRAVAAAPPAQAATVAAGGTPLFKLVNPQRVWLILSMPAEQAARLAEGDQVPVRLPHLAEPERPFSVWQISEPEDAERLVVLSPAGPFSGQLLGPRWVSAALRLQDRQGWSVPLTALDRSGPQTWVRRVRAGGVERVPVQLLGIEGDHVVVWGELQVGDQVQLHLPDH